VIDPTDTAVLMPVFNEERTVGAVIDAVRANFDGPLVVVDDGSTDGTPAVLAARDDIKVITLCDNCGYGCALMRGFRWAAERGAERLITMDCDGQHEPRHIGQFLDVLKAPDSPDIVSGSRYLPQSGSAGQAPQQRLQVNRRVTAEINSVTGWSLTDSFCGFKGYHMSALARLTLSEPGYAMPLELWAKAWRAGLSVIEIPVERIYCDHERSFGEHLDDPEERFRYYMDVWHAALEEE
jgi:glycosyltransferase involved in cell wall biosynthesis